MFLLRGALLSAANTASSIEKQTPENSETLIIKNLGCRDAPGVAFPALCGFHVYNAVAAKME